MLWYQIFEDWSISFYVVQFAKKYKKHEKSKGEGYESKGLPNSDFG